MINYTIPKQKGYIPSAEEFSIEEQNRVAEIIIKNPLLTNKEILVELSLQDRLADRVKKIFSDD